MASLAVLASTAAAAVNVQRTRAVKPASSGAAFQAVALRRRSAAPRRQLRVAAMVEGMVFEWTDPNYTAEVLASFPEKMIANVEEARCLIEKGGYTYLDVRPTLELEAAGKYRQCVNIPIMNAKWKFDSETRKREMVKEDNDMFITQVEKRFPNKDTPLLIGCSDGRAYSIDALEVLDGAGYTNLVGLKGGFYNWFRVFDNKGGRRRNGEYQENYGHDGDSCGIHSSGAGFERVDSIERWVPPKF